MCKLRARLQGSPKAKEERKKSVKIWARGTKILPKILKKYLKKKIENKKNKSHLGVIKFNLINKNSNSKIIALGGINENNKNMLSLLNISTLDDMKWKLCFKTPVPFEKFK